METTKKLISVLSQIPTQKGMGLPLLLWGDPGIGKSSVIDQVAESMGAHLEVIIPSQKSPIDIAGMPVPGNIETLSNGQSYKQTHLSPPSWAIRAEKAAQDGDGAIIFIDELTTAPQSVQRTLLEVVLERRVGEFQFSDNIAILAAANPPLQGGNPMVAPLISRFIHYSFPCPSVESWGNWLMGGSEEGFSSRFSEEKYRGELAGAKGDILGFLRNNPSFKQEGPPMKRLMEEYGKDVCYPCPRSWNMAILAIAALRSHDLPGKIPEITEGIVGREASIVLFEYLSEMDLPDPRDVLKEKRFQIDETRLDRTTATMSNLESYVFAEENRSVDNIYRLCKVLEFLMSKGLSDVAYRTAITIRKQRGFDRLEEEGEKEKRLSDTILRDLLDFCIESEVSIS